MLALVVARATLMKTSGCNINIASMGLPYCTLKSDFVISQSNVQNTIFIGLFVIQKYPNINQ